ncbi:MAG: hypothetical protein U0931_20965 [Vulcanimicrobiota bacterium]
MRGRAAFSLLEMSLTIALLAVLVGLSLANLGGSRRQAEISTLANSLVEELRSARQLAIRSQQPVALAIPAGTGATQDLYLLSGQHQPRILRSWSYAREYPEARIFPAHWPARAAWTLSRPQTAWADESFHWQDWYDSGGPPQAALYIFLPWGNVVSNDRPLLNGHYAFCVGQQGWVAPATFPGSLAGAAPYFELSRVSQAWSVTITPTGQVESRAGLEDQAAASSSGLPPELATAPAVPREQNAPEILAVEFDPPAPPELGSSLDTRVAADGWIRLTCCARDRDGDNLYCSWRSLNGGGLGQQGRSRLDYDAARGCWLASTVWRPDPRDPEHKIYHLVCDVSDERGALQSTEGTAQVVDVELIRSEKILVTSQQAQDYLVTINSDGSDLKAITPADFRAYQGEIAPDGTRLVATTNRAGTPDLWMLNIDGTGLRRLTEDPGDELAASWDGEGRRVVYTTNRNGRWELWMMDAAGLLPQSPAVTTGPHWRVTDSPAVDWWSKARLSPDGRRLVFSGDSDPSALTNSDLFVVELPVLPGPGDPAPAPMPAQRLTSHPGADYAPAFSPANPNQLVFTSDRGGSFGAYTLDLPADGPYSAEQGITLLAGSAGQAIDQATWSHDGSRWLVRAYSNPAGPFTIASLLPGAGPLQKLLTGAYQGASW